MSIFDNRHGVDPKTVHRVVALYARGRRAQQIADATTLPVAVVTRIGAQHGAPDLGRLASTAEAMAKELARTPPGGDPQPGHLDLAHLARAAQEIGNKKLQRRAEWIAEQYAKLTADLTEARRLWTAGRQAREAREKKLAELEQLKARQAELRAELGLADRDHHQPSGLNREIRDWAQAAGIPCPVHGKIPAAVRTAWEQAHPDRAQAVTR